MEAYLNFHTNRLASIAENSSHITSEEHTNKHRHTDDNNSRTQLHSTNARRMWLVFVCSNKNGTHTNKEIRCSQPTRASNLLCVVVCHANSKQPRGHQTTTTRCESVQLCELYVCGWSGSCLCCDVCDLWVVGALLVLLLSCFDETGKPARFVEICGVIRIINIIIRFSWFTLT